MHNFNPGGANSDGALSQGLVLGRDGNLYGTAYGGGQTGGGTVFRINGDGSLTTLHDFTSSSDGFHPPAPLIQGSNGNFYGVTSSGGSGFGGTVFSISSDGVFNTLYSFNDNSVGFPFGGLVQGPDGNLYGTTTGTTFDQVSSTNNPGTIFGITPGGTLSILYGINPASSHYTPVSSLALGSDGSFYGTAVNASFSNGSIFTFTSNGGLTTLFSTGGAFLAGLIQGGDGNFYGATANGGLNASGSVFRATTSSGAFTDLYDFTSTDANGENLDGSYPMAALVQDSDGSFYGTTFYGGKSGNGTVFKIAPSGAFTSIYSFSTLDTNGENLDGASPPGTLVKGADGNFYGTTQNGGTGGNGNVFMLALAAPAITGNLKPPSRQGVSFGYQITASNNPTSYAASGLPAGLAVNTGTGRISGTPTVYGTFSVALTASNAAGPGTATLTIVVKQAVPVISSTLNPPARAGVPFSYQITATNNPATFAATVSVPGLTSTSTGRIYGTPTMAGTFSVPISAGNSGGTGTAALTIVVKQGIPAITSSLNPPARMGVPFSYQITATNDPTKFSAVVPVPGLSFNAARGIISGTPTAAGTYGNVTIAANNSDAGSGNVPLTLVVKEAVPVITSSLAPPSRVGVPFGYQITATNEPTGYGAAGLPAGLAINQTTGKISGTPTKAGTYRSTIKAINGGGSALATLDLEVKAALPVITSELDPPARVGNPFSYTLTAANNVTSYRAVLDVPGLSFSPGTHKITGTPTQAGTYTVKLAVTNSAGSTGATMSLHVKQVVPQITSSLNPPSRQGVAFSYQISATGSPTSFGESGLPAGLSINQTTGKITGKPTKSGTYKVILKASNSDSAGTAMMTLTVKPPD